MEPFKCPACTPDMLAISADGNRKHYRFKKSKGSVESFLYIYIYIYIYIRWHSGLLCSPAID